jgi:hypothetical protein
MSVISSPVSAWSVRRLKFIEAAVLLLAAWLVPMLIHLAPWSGERPLGVHLLPVFWTALVAVRFYGLGFALIVGLLTPVVNLAVTGLPALGRIGPMALEVIFFLLLVFWLSVRWPRFLLAAPTAFLAASAAVIAIQWSLPAFEYQRDPIHHWVATGKNAWAGLLVMLFIDIGLTAVRQRAEDWDS